MRYTRRTLVGSAGIAATVLLHTLLVAVTVWGGGHPVPRPKLPDAVGAGANSGQPVGEMGERRIVVMLTPEIQNTAPPPELVPHLLEPSLPSILQITGSDALPIPPIIDIPGEEPEAEDAQLMARAKFAGIYESQTRARIARAWEALQKSPISDFSCLVEILQARDGRVREVVLVRCDDSLLLQQSLVDAIQAASPLPAPPHPSAFVERFSLEFHWNSAGPQNGRAQRN